MRSIWKLTALCSLLILFLTSVSWSGSAQWSDPELVNQLITEVDPPVFGPGETAVLSFIFTNPFPHTMYDIKLEAQPYLLVYQDGKADWSGLVDPPSMVNATTGSSVVMIPSLLSQGNITVEWSIITTSATSRGSMFTQSTYFVRLNLTFTAESEKVSYASRGCYTEDEWKNLTETAGQDPTGFNTTYLKALGYSGIIPDVSFIVRDDIPLWPAFAIVGVACFTGTIAIYYHLKADPMVAPLAYTILIKIRRGFRRILPKRRNR